ncbi:unannotated protein [freshwater metagenome]|uniref:Unannotated protein n=1 Tax=freshwater metagenome TaxID=449393 RepID=A0A6J7HHD8_9ZZZZ
MARARLIDLALMLGALVVGTLLAELFGATNTGTALTFGTIAFLATLVFVLLRR